MTLAPNFSIPKWLSVGQCGDWSGRGEDDPIWSSRLRRDGWKLTAYPETTKDDRGAEVGSSLTLRSSGKRRIRSGPTSTPSKCRSSGSKGGKVLGISSSIQCSARMDIPERSEEAIGPIVKAIGQEMMICYSRNGSGANIFGGQNEVLKKD